MIDITKIGELLKEALREAVIQLQSENSGMSFYSLCLLASPTLTSFSVIGNTEQHLMESSEKCGYDKDELRWNVGDWSVQLSNDIIVFSQINSYMKQLHDIEDDEYDQAFSTITEKIYEVLKSLDKNGVFSLNQQRDSVYVNLVFSEQSEDELLFKADLLNNSSKVLGAIENGTSI